jgi:DNA-binding NtrC family response regulator
MSKSVILCVDDEMGILKSLERCLVMGGYEVVLACGGEEGLRALEAREGRVDMIIVDHRMPNMAGEEFLARAKEQYGPLKAIMLSGYADFETLVKAVNEGLIFYFLPKPWDNRDLLKVVGAAVVPQEQPVDLTRVMP